MADGHRLDHRALVALGAGLPWLLLLLGDPGPVNGDAAVYAHSAAAGTPADRWIHAAYVAFLMMIGPIGARIAVPFALMLSIVLLTRWNLTQGRSAALTSLWVTAAVLPWAVGPEVEPFWALGVGVGLVGSTRVGAMGLGVAVAVSPTALAAVPWIARERGDRRWLGAAVAVVALTLLSGAAWWTGRRGLLEGHWRPDPLQHLLWLVPAWIVSRPRFRVRDGLAAAGFLAPSDLPGHWIAGLPLLRGVSRRAGPWGLAAALVAVGASLVITVVEHDRIRAENEQIAEWAAALEAGDAVAGPWSLRVRVAIRATGDPDGLPRCHTRRLVVPEGTWERCR